MNNELELLNYQTEEISSFLLDDKRIKKLYIFDSEIYNIGDNVDKFKYLKKISLNHTYINYLSNKIFFLPCIKSIDIYACHIDLKNLQNIKSRFLKKLNLVQNDIKKVPNFQKNRIETISLAHNKIKHIGNEFDKCRKLKKLYLGGNKLKYFPKTLCKLKLKILLL